MHNAPVVELRHIHKHYHGTPILNDFNLKVERGEFLTLLGPSGCGKTTLLHLLAGFEKPDTGDVLLEGKCVNDIPPHHRNVNTVFQSYALFPHLSVFDNIAFGLNCQHLDKKDIKRRVEHALAMVKLSNFGSRMPHQLSGGQQQRVALARAVVNEPAVLLFDEPFSALDHRLRQTMQRELKALQRKLKLTFIFITHDQEEALALSDRIVLMSERGIEHIGTPREVYEEPRNLWTANFIGEVNIFETRILKTTAERLTVDIENKTFDLQNTKRFNQDDRIVTLLRPEDIKVWAKGEKEDTSAMLPGLIEQVVYKGSTVDLTIRLSSGTLIRATEFFDDDDDTLAYERGEKVWVEWYPGWEVLLPDEAT